MARGLGLSDAVGGFIDGAQARQRMNLAQADQAWQNEARGRQRTQWQEDDRRKAIDKEAQEAGARILDEVPQAQGLGAIDRYNNIGGTDSSMPAQAGLDSAMPAQKPVAQAPMTKKRLLDAYDAALQVHRKHNDLEGIVKTYAKSAAVRTDIRNETLDRELQFLQGGGDAETALKNAYGVIFDGQDITKTERLTSPGPDGKTSAPMIRVHLSNGGVRMVPEAKVPEMLMWARANGEELLKHELGKRLAEAKEAAKIPAIRAKGDEDRETAGLKHSNDLSLAGVNNTAAQQRTDTTAGATLGSARIGADSRITAANIGASAARYGADKRDGGGGSAGGAGARVQSTHVNADGNVVAILRDGTAKVLTDATGSPIKSATWSKRVDALAATLAKSRQFRSMSGSEVRAEAERILGSGEEPPADGPGTPRTPGLNDATLRGAASPPPRGPGLSDATRPGAGTPESKFVEGKVYKDARGNQARYEGGKWVLLK